MGTTDGNTYSGYIDASKQNNSKTKNSGDGNGDKTKGLFSASGKYTFGALASGQENPNSANVDNAVHTYNEVKFGAQYIFPNTPLAATVSFNSTNYNKDGASYYNWGNGLNTGNLFVRDENGNLQISAEGLNSNEFIAGLKLVPGENFNVSVGGGLNTSTAIPLNVFGWGANLPVTSRNSLVVTAEASAEIGRVTFLAEGKAYTQGDLSFTGAIPSNQAKFSIGYNLVESKMAKVNFFAGVGYNWGGNYENVVNALGAYAAAQQGVPYQNIGAPNLQNTWNFSVGIQAEIGRSNRGTDKTTPKDGLSANQPSLLQLQESVMKDAKAAAAGLTSTTASQASAADIKSSAPTINVEKTSGTVLPR
jgi:hypothetical protein